MKMPWKDVYYQTEEDAKSITKRARKVKNRPLFNLAYTRKGKELVQQKNCKITTEKKLTKDQRELYYQILDEKRRKKNK